MSVTTLPDFETGPEIRDDGAGIGLWTLSLLAILGIHAAALAWLITRPPIEPIPFEETPPIIMIELAPEPIAIPTPPAPPPPPPPPPEPEIIPETPILPAPEVELPKPPPDPPKPKPPEPKPRPRIERPPQKVVPRQETQAPIDAPVTTAPPLPGPPSVVEAPPAPPAQVVNWKGVLLGHLQRNKQYPRTAVMRGIQGRVTLRFKMDREGHVLSSSIERSSGASMLDEEVMNMIRRAQPLPKPPPEIPDSDLEYSVPIDFSLQR